MEGGGVLRGQGGGGLLEHVHEPVDFHGDGGVADVAAGGGGGVGAEGVDDGMAGGWEDDEVRDTDVGSAKFGQESDGARGVVVFGVGGEFAGVEGGDDEGFIEDGFVGGVVEEVLEHVARAAPGGAKDEQDVFVLRGRGGAGLGEDLAGGGFGVQRGREEDRGGDEGGAEEGAGRKGHGLSDSPGQEVWG